MSVTRIRPKSSGQSSGASSSSFNRAENNKLSQQETINGGVQKSSEARFQDHLESSNTSLSSSGLNIALINNRGEVNEEALVRLQDRVHESGDALLRRPGYDNAIEYKKAVSDLLNTIVPHIHKNEYFTALQKRDGKVNTIKMKLVNKVHEKLDKVLQLVLSSQSDQLQIMKSLDEIKGLIVDLLS